ncbi:MULTISPECIES: CHAT domain-containing protein [Aerosakkonema]|uniref:CHAT domain-containing protein n=1 Tax=Aerosakkonema TaxID=1246629 RepID=UPI0035B8C603
MNSKRREDYHQLIYQLLTCRNGEPSKIMMANLNLIDDGLVQALKEIATMMAQQGNQQYADYLNYVADRLPLEPFFERSVTNQENTIKEPSLKANPIEIPSYLGEIFQIFAENRGDTQRLYKLLSPYLDKLDDNFVEQFRHWIFSIKHSQSSEVLHNLAILIGDFSNHLWQCPFGNRTLNLEVALIGCEFFELVFSPDEFPEEWAKNQLNQAPIYRHRIRGNRADNLEKAKSACEQALQVYTRNSFPEEWARIQNNLGLIYNDRIVGEKRDNVEKAIACYETALQVVNRSQLPELWGMLQNNLGNAYLSRIQGNKTENIEKAIACYQVALQVRTRSASPYYWASSQFNLGSAYTQRILGNKQQNLEKAISAYINALEVYTISDYPERWAGTKSSLGNAYYETGQITEPVDCLRSALQVFTPTNFPRDCIKTGLNLGKVALAADMKAEAFEGYAIAIEAVEQSRRWAGTVVHKQEIPEEVFVYTNMVVFCILNGERDKAREYAERSASPQLLKLLDTDEIQQIYSKLEFIGQILQATAENDSKPEVLYQILESNINKLNDEFVQELRNFEKNLGGMASFQAINVAANIFNFSNLIWHFPQGKRAINFRIAITGYEIAATVFTKEAFPEQWENVQNALRGIFQMQLFEAILENQKNPEGLYPLLEENKHKLDERFATILRLKTTDMLSEMPPEDAKGFAAILVALSAIIQELTQGKEANNLEIAITGYEVASTVLTHEVFPEQWAVCQIFLGNAYHRRVKGDTAENLEKAIAHLQNALQSRTREAFPELWAEIQSNLVIAYGYRIRGDRLENAELAIAAGMAAMEVYTREAFPEGWGKIQNNLGIVYRDRLDGDKAENLELAIACYQNALLIRTREDFPELWAQTHMNLGSAYRQRLKGDEVENLELAIAANFAALQVYTKEAFPRDWAGVQMNLGNAYLHRKKGNAVENLKNSLLAHQAALEILTFDEFPQEWATTQMNLGNTYRFQGQEEKAIACYQSALKVFTPTAFPEQCLITGRNLGSLAFSLRKWTEAIEGYSIAIEAVETSRTWATSEFRRQEILTDAIDIYQNIVQACINNKQLDKAIEYVERSRSKRLVDLIASNDLYSSGEIPIEIQQYLQKFEALQQQIDNQRERHYVSSNFEGNQIGYNQQKRAAIQAYNETIASLEAEKQLVWEQIRRLDPVLAGQIQVNSLNLSSIQQLIDQPNTAILSFYTTINATHIFVIKQNQISLHGCKELTFNALGRKVLADWLIPYIENKEIWKEKFSSMLAELAEFLKFKDLIAQHLDEISELIIVPHLGLHQIPFAALPIADGEYLGDKFLIRYTPSCQVLEFCQQRPSLGNNLKYGLVEDATGDLPYASFEGEKLAALYNIPDNRRLKGRQEATVSKYQKLAQRVEVLHSSHHASSRLDNPLESMLILGDGCITLGQLMTPGWRLPQLSDVFLSCCETGLGITEITDDILTFSTGFLSAGARSVISTLWSVDDLATALFSIFYYQYRQQGLNRIEALRQAQVSLRNLTGEQLNNVYKLQLELLLRQKLKISEIQRKEIKKQRDGYLPSSELYQQWDEEYKRCDRLGKVIYESLTNLKYFCQQLNPFSHPFFWAAFICTGRG